MVELVSRLGCSLASAIIKVVVASVVKFLIHVAWPLHAVCIIH